jgi:hypothetical protein
MQELLLQLTSAAEQGAPEIEARLSDGSFLESTLEKAIAKHLPGAVSIAQQRRRFPLEGYKPPPNGVDIEWMTNATRAAIEVKVTDVLDSLFDIFKLATAVAHGYFKIGFCAVAATRGQWLRGGPVAAMVDAPRGAWSEWQARELLVGAAIDAVLVPTGPRPLSVPAQLQTMAAEPIELPRAGTHVLQVLGVTATTTRMISLPG